MMKSFFIAAALVIATPGILFSQDIFWSFDNDARTTSAGLASGTVGSAYLFAEEPYFFLSADIDITSSNSAVATLLGGTGIDGEFATGGTRFDSSLVTVDATTGIGNWFAVNVTQNGIDPDLAQFDPNFVPGVGHLLAEVNYNVSGQAGETSTLELALGDQGIVHTPLGIFIPPPTFGSATLTVVVPEPSSAILLVLGSVGLVTRRRFA